MANDVLSLLGCLSASAGRNKTVRLLYHLAHFYAWYLASTTACSIVQKHTAISLSLIKILSNVIFSQHCITRRQTIRDLCDMIVSSAAVGSIILNGGPVSLLGAFSCTLNICSQ